MFNALIQLKIIQYWWWFWRQRCRDVAPGIDRHPDRTEFILDCRYRVIESSSLVPVLFREVFSHPYISFFHLLVNDFSVIIYKLSGTYQEEWEKQTINHDLYFFQLWVSMLLEHQVWMISIVARKASSLVLLSSSVSTTNLSCLLATTFTSLRFLFNFTSLQSFESGQALFFVVFYFLIFASYPQSSAFLSSVLPSLKLCLLEVSHF